VAFEALDEVPKVPAGELPLEGTSDLLVMVLEAQDAVFELVGGGEVVGRQHLPLEDREVDLDLVEPASGPSTLN
jgi:hypothetical protein